MKRMWHRDGFIDYPRVLDGQEPFYASDSLWGREGFSTCGLLPELYWDALVEMNPEYTVYSYETPIAWCKDGCWIMPHVRYDAITTARQKKIENAIGVINK